jgi:S-adenosylmethionine:tRNA ribosyltransferase-isomerase
MIAANRPVQRPRDARLLVVLADGSISHAPRSRLVELLRPGDLVVANDAATLPASLHGLHVPTGAEIEVRLAGREIRSYNEQRIRSYNEQRIRRSGDQERFCSPTEESPGLLISCSFSAIVFGAGDYRTRTEDRPLPPTVAPGDRLVLGPLSATIEALLDHPRLVSLRFSGRPDAVWAGLARHGRPIQYAHVPAPLALWDVWTPIAGAPAAFEPPSAGFAIDWATLRAMRARGISFASVTLAAGLSSTGDPELDRRLPFDEPYRIPGATAAAIRRAQLTGGRIVAVGTTVVRALEHAAQRAGVVRPGRGIADQRLGPFSRLRVVDAILSGTHEPGSSHYQLLRAFLEDATLAEASAALEARRYRTHEFGDSMLVANMRAQRVRRPAGSQLTLRSGTRTDGGADRGQQTGFVEGLVEVRGESGPLGLHVIGAADEARHGDHRRPIVVGP